MMWGGYSWGWMAPFMGVSAVLWWGPRGALRPVGPTGSGIGRGAPPDRGRSAVVDRRAGGPVAAGARPPAHRGGEPRPSPALARPRCDVQGVGFDPGVGAGEHEAAVVVVEPPHPECGLPSAWSTPTIWPCRRGDASVSPSTINQYPTCACSRTSS